MYDKVIDKVWSISCYISHMLEQLRWSVNS